MDKLIGQIKSRGGVTGSVSAAKTEYIHDRLPDYTGNYEVIPGVIEQVLKTKDTSMKDDLAVKPIPYQEVSNIYGTTVSIGS